MKNNSKESKIARLTKLHDKAKDRLDAEIVRSAPEHMRKANLSAIHRDVRQSASDDCWVSCEDRKPDIGQRLIGKCLGVYGTKILTYCQVIIKGRSRPQFGTPSEGGPVQVTHWIPM